MINNGKYKYNYEISLNDTTIERIIFELRKNSLSKPV